MHSVRTVRLVFPHSLENHKLNKALHVQEDLKLQQLSEADCSSQMSWKCSNARKLKNNAEKPACPIIYPH